MSSCQRKIAVIGLGYVGLPVAVAFGQKSEVIGFDVSKKRLQSLQKGHDYNNEVTSAELAASKITYTDDIEKLRSADFFIVTVPTPVTDAHQPDLVPVYMATESVGKALKKGDIVVYESTVYPGVTEEECLPILERVSGLKGGIDFKVGYSPERINPGDKERQFTTIRKVVSGMDAEALEIVASTYESVVTAGVFRAASIKVAEAAKVIENTQRDLNIALMNELALIFGKMGIDTQDVLQAAGTKWNFMKFVPGLVGGHCIGVDPYYLTHKAEVLGYHPQVILAGRRINDAMGRHVAQCLIKELIHAGKNVQNSTVTVLGLTFKENCPDIRNSKVVDVIQELRDFGVNVQVHDPLADGEESKSHYGITLTSYEKLKTADAIIVAVAHDEYRKITPAQLKELMNAPGVVCDLKSIFDPAVLRDVGLRLWRL